MIRLSAALAAFALLAAPAAAQDGPFADWLNDFRPRLAAQASPATVAAMLDGLEPDTRAIDRDRDQPEFVRPLWQYLASAASDDRVRNGRAAKAREAAALAAIEAEYGVPADILTAIWGLESAYGAIMGNFDVVQTLATLAWEGRRRNWAEAQLLAVGRMLDAGYARREDLRGSWAGAMGQTQFIPETYMARAVDWTGDGRRDIWNNAGDALASAANLLSRAGWREGAPVAVEVTLPDGFDMAAWDPAQRRMVSEWAARGVRPAGGEWRADDLMRAGALILPAGRRGPGFVTFANFDAILRYNNSTAYGLGVWLLSERIGGEAAITGAWPENDPPVTRSQTREMQEALAALGHDPGTPDGVFGPNTRRALRAFQISRGHPADGYAGRVMYDAVIAAAAAEG
ncbi:MAG: lytic murein transglycosylase [Maricaulaceae bacterium]|nr:lytic murein transglycosylase [Maricaulaceae bacterium]